MGKIFLIAIAAGIVWTGSVIWSWFQSSPGEAVEPVVSGLESSGSHIANPVQEHQQANEGTMSASREESGHEWLPWPVLAWCDDWVYIEGWGSTKVGEELPTGEVLEGWTDKSLIVRGDNGKKYERIRRIQEAFRTLVHQVGMVSPGVGDK